MLHVAKVIGARLINNEREREGGRDGGTERAFVGVKSVIAAPAAMPSVGGGSGTARGCAYAKDGRDDGGRAQPADEDEARERARRPQ